MYRARMDNLQADSATADRSSVRQFPLINIFFMTHMCLSTSTSIVP